ncbi:hypothetical protein D3C86_2009490 [compost metagenome]
MPPFIIGIADVTSMREGPIPSAASRIAALVSSVAPASQASSKRLGVARLASGNNRSRMAAAVASGT